MTAPGSGAALAGADTNVGLGGPRGEDDLREEAGPPQRLGGVVHVHRRGRRGGGDPPPEVDVNGTRQVSGKPHWVRGSADAIDPPGF